MNKEQFLSQLNKSLQRLPASEREDILQDFQEHFEIGISTGKTEEEIAKGLGSPQQIAKEMIVTYRLEQVEETSSTGNILRAVWAVIGLGFFNLVIVLGPFLVLAGIILSGWLMGISFAAAPLLFVFNIAIYPAGFSMFEMFSSLLLSGIGIFIIIAMFYVTRWIAKGFIKYLNFNARMVKGGMKHA